ncbi:aprataxin and PNK-like factor isoform X2 [Achroia grisella]|uniref:aprataxin and PNK-like factor isoform X2 n=1 Tax=Achroia grisella TaxID=688607 RepID=UPI0027D2C4DE|nr:aprataxin and PNK-like factor isoform X2 [Achroia grisella]
MVFKLVRTDSEDPYKIQLEIGTHLIGRGKFLNCDDKRVSRNHGELQVSEDTVIIKALHQNPCFYLKKDKEGTQNTEILRQNCSVALNNGDKFGMLPDSCWYEVLYCTISDVNKTPEDQGVDESDRYTVNTEIMDDNVIVEHFDEEKEKRPKCNDAPASPSLLDFDKEKEPPRTKYDEGDTSESASLLDEHPIKIEATLTTDNTSKNNDGEANDENAIKRCHSPTQNSDDASTKKVKTEEDIKQEAEDVQPGPSNDQLNANDTSQDKKSPPTPAKPQQSQLRERCIYGASCYRRNPQHKTQFSHPADADWGGGERGECPWGRACRRRDPRHWQIHQHPPGTQPPPPHARPGNRRVRKRSDDTPPQDLILHGKRLRKTIDIPKWSDSESNSDPYETDGSDDWQPSSTNDTESQYTQDIDD